MTKRRKGKTRKDLERKEAQGDEAYKNWDVSCQNCGEKPTVADLALCGPCCFGEAETLGGNW